MLLARVRKGREIWRTIDISTLTGQLFGDRTKYNGLKLYETFVDIRCEFVKKTQLLYQCVSLWVFQLNQRSYYTMALEVLKRRLEAQLLYLISSSSGVGD